MSRLVDTANDFIFHCVTASTRNTYEHAMNSYINCFLDHGTTAPFPATQTSLCAWMAWAATRTTRPLAASSLRTYLSSLVSLHTEFGYADLLDDKPLVYRCFTGIKKTKGIATKIQRLPITTELLAKLKPMLNDSFACKLWFAAATAATYGLLRMGEFTIQQDNSNAFRLITLAQLQLHTDNSKLLPLTTVVTSATQQHRSAVNHYSLTLRTSKTDPFRKTVTIHIANPIAVKAMVTYLRAHPAIHQPQSPLFVMSNANPTATNRLAALDRTNMISATRAIIARLGLNEQHYNGHSFRKGGATSMAKAGIPDSVIQLVGRWSSDCYKLYVTTPLDTLLDASRSM